MAIGLVMSGSLAMTVALKPGCISKVFTVSAAVRAPPFG